MDGKPWLCKLEGQGRRQLQLDPGGRIPTPTTEHSPLHSRVTGMVLTLLNIIFPETSRLAFVQVRPSQTDG